MRTAAIVLAAGQGTRFGGDKTARELGGKPLWRWSYDLFATHPEVHEVLLVGSQANLAEFRAEGVPAVLGGETRQDSARLGVEALPRDIECVLIHDAARPYLNASLVTRVLEGVRQAGAAAPGVPVVDTIRQREGEVSRNLDRASLVAMQTPQGARYEHLVRAYREAPGSFTDEVSLLEAIGVQARIVPGDPKNLKITYPGDLMASDPAMKETRTGFGYDIHPFSEDASRVLMLGGVAFPGHPALAGHSDADVILHAAVDALLGAAALGDIGQHFPNDDPRWRGAPSTHFLRHAGELLAQGGGRIVSLDIAVVAETPKIGPRAEEMRARIAETLGIDPRRVGLKATTNERLGAIGRGEGIAAMATASVEFPVPGW